MSVFNDEEVKWLKDTCYRHGSCENGCLYKPITAKETVALLARLEAAERVISAEDYTMLDRDLYEAWCKAAGK